MTSWFRRPDGVLVAARYPANEERCLSRGYKHVAEKDALEEIESGKQAEANAQRAQSDADDRERRLAAERQAKAQARREAARRVVEDAQLQTDPAKPPEVDQEAVNKALAEGHTPPLG